MNKNINQYNDDSIKSLDWKEHIRLRPGMYIGKLGDGNSSDDGIYVLLKEIIDNCIDEFVMGYGKTIDVNIDKDLVTVRDYGRGIPLNKVVDCVSKINTGGKYDSVAFKKSVGLNGVGLKAVNALSSWFNVESFRDKKVKKIIFNKGDIVENNNISKTLESNGTKVVFIPDEGIFNHFNYNITHVEELIYTYTYLNPKLIINLNGKKYRSKNGLLDLLSNKTNGIVIKYPIIHLKSDDVEIAFTHGNNYGETNFSYVNGQYTTQGGTHLTGFKESLVKTLRDFYKKDFDPSDIRASIISAISIRIQNPIFESQTKTKLGSNEMAPDGKSIRLFISEFMRKKLDNFLHKNPVIASSLLDRILQSERERKDMAGIKKLATKRAKKANLFNKKLRDCKLHYNDQKIDDEKRLLTTIFITEGDSASGSITKSREVKTQAVFSLRGKPLNSFGLRKKIVYENEEFNLLQHALNIENGIENLRYNRIVIATDADVDGMHIRLLILTFILQFFPELVRNGHLYILETPLFRVRNKKETIYAYDSNELEIALGKLGDKAEITRFKGLGEISPNEFKQFIGEQMRLEKVQLTSEESIESILSYYMGKNTPSRQEFIIDNLRKE